MKKNLLMGTTLSGSGKELHRILTELVFQVDVCGNNTEAIHINLSQGNYDGLIVFIKNSTDKLIPELRSILRIYPQLNIYAVIMFDSESMMQNFASIDNIEFFGIGSYISNLPSAIFTDMRISEKMRFDPKILDYLIKAGLPYDMIGLYYLAVGIEKCIDKPEFIDDLVKGLYREIANVYEKSPTAIERGLRKLAGIAEERKISFDDESAAHLTTGKMIAAARNGYLKYLSKKNSDT